MVDLSTTANVAQIFSVIAPAAFGTWAIWRRIDKRQTDAHIMSLRISDKLDFIEKQFGPNGGGIREAVNNMAHKVDKIETRINIVDAKLANLGGKFDQHIIETDN